MIQVHYDGKQVRIDGWLPTPAAFAIPQGGSVELRLSNGALELICRDRRGAIKPMAIQPVP